MKIPDLTPEQIEACLEARISKSKFCKRPVITWRTVALNLRMSPQRVLKHFAPDELDKYRAQLKRLKKPDAPRRPRVFRQISPGEMEKIIKAYRAGFSAVWISGRLPAGIGRKRVADVFAKLANDHGAAREAAKNRPKASRKLTEYGVRPTRFYRREENAAHRPPPWAIADRDRRANLRHQSIDPNVIILGQPIFEQSALYKKLQQQSAGGALTDNGKP